MDNAYEAIERHQLRLLEAEHKAAKEAFGSLIHRNAFNRVEAFEKSLHVPTPKAKRAHPITLTKACEHTMQSMFRAHNDAYAGQRCTKCGYSEYV